MMLRPILLTAIAGLAFASAVAQTDATQYIKNPSFESGLSNWKTENLQSQSNSSFTVKAGTLYAEKWVSSGNNVGNALASQRVTNLPAGVYQLTVAAQNLNQSNTSARCEGAYIFADDQRTTVYTPADYVVEFTTLTGSVEIGFKAEGAKGNWLAVDNFRLTRVGDISTEQLYATLVEQIHVADSLLAYDMDAKVKGQLQNAADQGRQIASDADQNTIQNAVSQLVYWIEKAEFAILLANATPGMGTAPKVTITNHYVPTGATEALMRAAMTGTNAVERGVCWSTDHNPTVLDERTTEYYTLNGNIYHVTGLTPATVYYLRPYIMNKTYQVAYGDEVKIVTHPKGTCTGSWDNGAPDAAANARCRDAINQTIAYFNEWTGIMGFTLSGHYGAQTPTADCSYGGWMRIGPNAGNQAIGTVIHETGHGVGVGTSARWNDTNFHNWRWLGREGNRMFQFLENKEGDEAYYMVGDSQHSWGQNASYDWFVNGADKDKHTPLQYIGGCCLLYAYFIDGLCPTSGYTNGISGYTYNFDADSTYYIMCKDAARGLDTGLVYMKSVGSYRRLAVSYCLNDQEEIPAEAGFKFEYDAKNGRYMIRSAVDGKYLTHATRTSVALKDIASPGATEQFQLMPDRTDVTLTSNGANLKTHGYWFTWNDAGDRVVSAHLTNANGTFVPEDYNATDAATKQQFIILTASQVAQLKPAVTAIEQIEEAHDQDASDSENVIYNLSGQRVAATTPGLFIINAKKTIIK